MFSIKKRYARIISICFMPYLLLTGCTTIPLEINYQPFNDQSYAKRTNTATVHKGSIEKLLKSQYLLIGYIDVRRNIRKCYEDNTCVAVTDEMPSEDDVLREAADRGGDLVFILEDKDVSTNISKSYCTATTVNAITVNGTVQMITVCTSYAKIYGVLESKVNRALIWRLDPKNASIEANTHAIKLAMKTLSEQKKVGVDDQEGFNLFNKDKKEKYNAPIATILDRAYRGDKKAQALIGYAFGIGKGVEKDYERSLYWYKKSALQGYAVAQSDLGSLYYHGKGTRVDYTQAFYWIQKSAKQSYLRAEYNLCGLYSKGLGVTQNYAKAFMWCSQAAGKGHLSAMVNLANMYKHGRGVDVDNEKALKHYTTAANKGNAAAQYNLAANFFTGKIVKKDLKTAVTWLKKSAGQDFHHAQYMLAKIFNAGYGVAKNKKKALIWYKRAAKNGSKRAAVWLKNQKASIN